MNHRKLNLILAAAYLVAVVIFALDIFKWRIG